jgi:hypothetical protein
MKETGRAGETIEWLMSDIPSRSDPPELKFLAFLYPEIKDLAKHFLTLVSGVLVFSAAFSDRIISFGLATRFQKIALVIAWLLWIGAVVLIGLAIFVNFVAAVRTLGAVTLLSRGKKHDNSNLIRLTYIALDTGGACSLEGYWRWRYQPYPNYGEGGDVRSGIHRKEAFLREEDTSRNSNWQVSSRGYR